MEKIEKYLSQALKSVQLANIEAKRLKVLGKPTSNNNVAALNSAIAEESNNLAITTRQ